MDAMPSPGYTLVELLVVVTLVGLAAMVAMPSFSTGNAAKVDLAATEVANALRFAQSEALRTGEIHSVLVIPGTEQVTVERSNLDTVPVSADFTVRHPLTKQLYEFNVASNSATAGVEISNAGAPFDYAGTGSQNRLLFNAVGTPLFIDTGAGTSHHLSQARISLAYGGYERSVRVDPVTGRVRLQ